MVKKKWLEIDIYLWNYKRTTLEVLQTYIFPLIYVLRQDNLFESWHYFLEPEIRLRFLCDIGIARNLEKEVEETLTIWERKRWDIFAGHIWGSHGKEGKEYKGEADFYGFEVWEQCYKCWEAGADLALQLHSHLPERPILFHARRQVHLTLNQLGFSRFQETRFHFRMFSRNLRLLFFETLIGILKRGYK